MRPPEATPTLLYVLAVVALSWLLRQAAAGFIRRRGMRAREAAPLVVKALLPVGLALAAANVLLREPAAALLFNLLVVAVQAGAMLLTLRLAEGLPDEGPGALPQDRGCG